MLSHPFALESVPRGAGVPKDIKRPMVQTPRVINSEEGGWDPWKPTWHLGGWFCKQGTGPEKEGTQGQQRVLCLKGRRHEGSGRAITLQAPLCVVGTVIQELEQALASTQQAQGSLLAIHPTTDNFP